MNNSVLKVSNKNGKCFGTCFVIDKDKEGAYVATCGHVLQNCNEDEILVDDLDAHVIKNEYTNGLDLAILYVKGLSNISPLILSDDENFNNASNIHVIGFTSYMGKEKKEPMYDITIKDGIELNQIKSMKLYTKEEISRGYSGSPVICDNTKSVIGIVNIQDTKDKNYAINIQHLKNIYQIKSINTANKQFSKYNGLVSEIDTNKYEIIKREFEKEFEKSLESYSGLPKVWIKHTIHTQSEDSSIDINSLDTKIDVKDIISTPKNYIIKAREQYGLTTLSHYLKKEAWIRSSPKLWLRVDANELKPHNKEIEKVITKKLDDLDLVLNDVECIILDEFSNSIKDANKIFNKFHELYIDKYIVTMYSITNNPLLNESVEIPEHVEFITLYLWGMPRNDIRKVVSDYNSYRYIGDENDIVNKIVSDLEVLNIPRTALNCLTILKILESHFDDSPVNRTEMLGRILSLLFNVDDIPRYKTRPDLKDTEYTLGYFCELMIKENKYYFTREYFLNTLNIFCNEMEIDLDIDVIFHILYINHIIVERGNEYCFKFSYWIFYFSAKRMHQNSDFAEYIFENMNYVSYPELIEFYTGIDRSRTDALQMLANDITETCNIVDKKCGLPEEFNIYDITKWKPSDDTIEQMHNEVSDGVLNSNLPDEIKDEYADKSYDRTRPLKQDVHKILEEYSLLRLMRNISAGSKALRNSDYADPKTKHLLLKEILRGWDQISKVLIVLSPILSKQGYAILDGASFVLAENFGETIEERFRRIISLIPSNIVSWYKDDLFSKKMSSLLYNHSKEEDCNFKKHLLSLLILNKRPKDWEKHIERYIINEHKNSFYLLDIYGTLRAEYKYSFASNVNLKHMERLIKVCVTKHDLGIKSPNKKILQKFDNKNSYDQFIPKRDIED